MSVPPFSTLPLRAVQRSIDVVWSPQRPRPGLSVSLRIHIPHAERVTIVYPDDAELDERVLRALFSPLLRSIAAQHFPGILRELADKHGFPMAPNIRIGAPRTRWASRSSTGTISLSYLMLFFPEALLHHVLLHELCHIEHMNHGRDFHARLEEVDPLAKAHEAAMRSVVRDYIPAWLRG